MAWIDSLFKRMCELGASDLHMTSGRKPMFRLHGEMQEIEEAPVLDAKQMRQVLAEITPPENKEQYEKNWDTDFAYSIPGLARFRVNLFVDHRGPGAVFRQIPEEILTAQQLGLPQSIIDFGNLTKGLVLVTGPTGSGKSTTLAALIDHINKSRSDHIITIEDPIEFVHQDHRCLVNQREVGAQTRTFKAALRAALREDPDIVLVGEMRDLETIEIAIETAETGHLVFGTLHTSTAASTVDRIIDQFPADRQAQIRTMLASSLKGVVAQTLCKKKGGGRVAALEILVVNSGISNQIREGKTHQIPSMMQMGAKAGMRLLNDSLAELCEQDKVTPEEAYLKAIDKDGFVARLGASGKKVDFSKLGADAAPATPVPGGAAGAAPGAPPAGAQGQTQAAPQPQGGAYPSGHGGGAQPQPGAPLPSERSAPEESPSPGAGAAGFADPFEQFKKNQRGF